MVDERTLFIPEESGNRLHQTLRNLRESRGIGLLFLLPGMPETARVNGTAEPVASTDPRWTELALGGVAVEPGTDTGVGTDPGAGPGPGEFRWGTVVHGAEAYYHCGRSSRFADLWDTAAITGNQARPAPAEALRTRTAAAAPLTAPARGRPVGQGPSDAADQGRWVRPGRARLRCRAVSPVLEWVARRR